MARRKRCRMADDEDASDLECDDQGTPSTIHVVDHHVYFYCDVTAATGLKLQLTMDRLVPQLKTRGYDEVVLYVSSDGGHVQPALAAYDALVHLDIWLTTVMTGACCSAATLIAMAGSTRAITEHAQMLLHQQRITFSGPHSHLSDEFSNQKLLTEQMLHVYGQAASCPRDTLRRLLTDEVVTTPRQALEMGLATDLWSA